MKRKILLTVLSALSLLIAGCVESYQDLAIEDAREFAMKKGKHLPENVRNYIRYTLPKIQEEVLFTDSDVLLTEYGHVIRNTKVFRKANPEHDYMHLCFVWDPPGTGYSVIVAGAGERNLHGWEPLKLVCKTVIPKNTGYITARDTAAAYVVSNMLYLSREETNRVRFSEAVVYETNFDVNFGQKTMPSSAWKEYLASLKENKDLEAQKQYSYIWKADDPKKRIVIAGNGEGGAWAPLSGMLITVQQLEEHTIRKDVMGPLHTVQQSMMTAPEKEMSVQKKEAAVPEKESAAPKRETDKK